MPSSSNTNRSIQTTENTPLLESEAKTSYASSSLFSSSSSVSFIDDDGTESGAETSSSASFPDDDGTDLKSEKPLPRLQILLLCYARFMEPVAFFSIFPYIAEMVQRNGKLPASQVGFYSGLVESLFSATQVAVLMLVGTRVDRIGRKKMLICSLVGMAVGPALFGLATSLWQIVLFRSLTGVFSGANFIIRTMIGQQCSIKTQAKAFSWYSVASNLGIFLGPIIGGALVDPVSQYPSAFAGFEFFEKYPYALPGLVVGTLSATAAISSALFLEETLKEEAVHVDIEEAPETHHSFSQLSVWQLLKIPNIFDVFWMYGYVMTLAIAFTALLPVVLYTPIDFGGMGCSPTEITLYIAVMGASETLWLTFVFPFLHRRLGTMGILHICSFAWPFFFIGYPSVNALLRDGSKAGRTLSFVVGFINALVGPGTWMSLTAVQLAINEVSPNQEFLGKLNSMAEICYSLVRTVIPGISTAIFAVGVQGHILSGYLAWWILFIFSLGLGFSFRRISLERG